MKYKIFEVQSLGEKRWYELMVLQKDGEFKYIKTYGLGASKWNKTFDSMKAAIKCAKYELNSIEESRKLIV